MIKLVIDCTCEMSCAEARAMGIIALPMRMVIDDQEYLAGENLTNAEFYQKLKTCKSLPKTMAVNPDDYINVIKPLLDAGDQVYAMSISSGLSSTYNNLRLASEQLNNPNLRIFDTHTFTLAYYALVMEVHKMIAKGATLDEIDARLTKLRDKVKIFTIIDNMKYLIKGGRIGFVKGLLAEALHIKPIISVVNKTLKMVGKGIGYNSAKKQMTKFTTKVDQTLPIYYGHANASEKAEDFKQTFKFKWTEKREIGPIIATHGGPGCVGLAFFEQ